MADVTVHHVIVSLVEGLHAVDYLEIAVVFVAEYLEIMQLVLEDISLKAVKAAALALANDVLQEVAPCNVDVQSGLYFAADGGLESTSYTTSLSSTPRTVNLEVRSAS